MAEASDREPHPDPEVLHVPPARKRSARRRVRWLARISLVLLSLQLMAYLGLTAPIVSPLIYANLAPPNWHNATPHGNMFLEDFDVSTDDPGLAVACAHLYTPAWPAPWAFGATRYWRSTDGGAQWRMIEPPFGSQDDCNMAMPPGGNGTVLATVSSNYESAPSTLWVSHDAGLSWRRVVTATAGDAAENLASGIHQLVYRRGRLYGWADFGSTAGGSAFAVSTDDGATWSALEQRPDPQEQQGWQVFAYAPDYRSDGWWYRDLTLDNAAPVLEHSQDDGATWLVVGPIGSASLGLMLATTPLAPDDLCAGPLSGEIGLVPLSASTDDGRTWLTGTMPGAIRDAQGETSLSVAMGATGACYEGLHYGKGQDPHVGNSYYGILTLARGSTVEGYMPLTDNGNSLSGMIVYVPASNGMSARLVTELNGSYPGWASLFSGLAAETTDGQIVWHAVP